MPFELLLSEPEQKCHGRLYTAAHANSCVAIRCKFERGI